MAGGPNDNDRRDSRRGAILVVVLVAFAMAAVLMVLAVRQVGLERQSQQANLRREQSRWLAEAGVERATARLAADPKYSGETWTVSAKDLAADRGGSVRIDVRAVSKQPKRREVRVFADWPDEPTWRCRSVKQVFVDLDRVASVRSNVAKKTTEP
ncbi:MAG: hypothetical protein ABFC77_11825 [Thermoguttaceae bacterium]